MEFDTLPLSISSDDNEHEDEINRFETIKMNDRNKKWYKKKRFAKDINKLDKNKDSMIHYGIVKDDLELVQYLIEHNVNPCLPNKNGMMSLHLAISLRRNEIAKYLLDIGVDYAIRNSKNDKTALDYAIESNDIELVKLIVSKIIKDKGIRFIIKKKVHVTKIFVDRIDIAYQNTLMCERKSILAAEEYLIPKFCGIKLDIYNSIAVTIKLVSMSFKFTESFIKAIQVGDLEIIDYLLNINFKLAKDILKKKKEMIKKKAIKEAILICLENGKIEIIKTILKYVNAENIIFSDQITIFHLLVSRICYNDDINHIMELITSNCNMINYKNSDGDTIFHLAAKNRQMELYNRLLEMGMNENDPNHMLETPRSIIGPIKKNLLF